MRVLSGIQPSGELHLGNYVGALKQFVELQNDYESFFSVVDLHAMTSLHDPNELRPLIASAKRVFLAIGLNPEKSTLFVQSDVPAHTELAWIFATITPLGELERMTQYKDKKAQGLEANAGLLTYPLLMAADILMYRAEKVPVGEDQVQHLELTGDIAKKFNKQFGELFVVPKPILRAGVSRIKSLQDPEKKMSKSLGPKHYVGLFEHADDIRDKFKRAVTDSEHDIRFDPDNKPGISNLLTIYGAIQGQPMDEVEQHFADKSYTELKEEVAEAVIAELKPIQQRAEELSDIDVAAAFKQGAERAQAEAEKTMREVRKRVGIA
ncbi:MAG: tryptophan--tRNA ligase [Candidatus Spechtbacterales bacterium]